MTEAKDLNQPLLLMDLLGRRESDCESAYAPGAFCEWCSPSGEPAEQIDVIENGLAKTGSGLVVVLSDMPNDFRQVA